MVLRFNEKNEALIRKMCKTKDSSETIRVTTEIEIFMQKATKIKFVSLYTDCQNEFEK